MTVTTELAKKVNVVDGKELSTNDFTDTYKTDVENNKKTLDELNKVTSYNLKDYGISGVVFERSSCVVKMNRVCIDFIGTTSITRNITATLINLPEEIRPKTNKNFVVVGQSTDSIYVGYGEITTGGAIQVTFTEDISSYTRFSVVYDLD